MNNTPTPETEAAKWTAAHYATNDYVQVVDASVAARLERERDQLRKVADAFASSEKCPNCDDVGWFTEWRRNVGGDPEPEQCQCEFCYTNEKSRFNAIQSYNSLPHVIAAKKGNAV